MKAEKAVGGEERREDFGEEGEPNCWCSRSLWSLSLQGIIPADLVYMWALQAEVPLLGI